jgi:pimeloyl-ACP methyl ester carboxylesterase
MNLNNKEGKLNQFTLSSDAGTVRFFSIQEKAKKRGVILFLQGWGISAFGIKKIAEIIAEYGWEVLLVDFTHLDKYQKLQKDQLQDLSRVKADTISAFLKNHYKEEKLSVIGHSEGAIVAAYVAQELAQNNRLNKILLVTPAGFVSSISFKKHIVRFLYSIIYHINRPMTFREVFMRMQYFSRMIFYIITNPIQMFKEGASLSRTNILPVINNLTKNKYQIDLFGYKDDVIFTINDLKQSTINDPEMISFHILDGGHHSIHLHPERFITKIKPILIKESL